MCPCCPNAYCTYLCLYQCGEVLLRIQSSSTFFIIKHCYIAESWKVIDNKLKQLRGTAVAFSNNVDKTSTEFLLTEHKPATMLIHTIFTARRSYDSTVLGVVFLSIHVWHACFLTKPNNALQTFWYRTKGNHSSFLTSTVIGGRRPLLSEICTQSDPPPSKNADFDRFPLITSQP